MGVGGRAYENASAAITEKFLADRREEVCRGQNQLKNGPAQMKSHAEYGRFGCKAADLVSRLREPVDLGVVGVSGLMDLICAVRRGCRDHSSSGVFEMRADSLGSGVVAEYVKGRGALCIGSEL